MTDTVPMAALLADIDRYLAASGMKESYFGKLAGGYGQFVPRLRNGSRVYPEIEERVRGWMRDNPPASRRTAPAALPRVENNGCAT